MEYRQDGWVQVDLKTGKEIRIQHLNPLILQIEDNEFNALSATAC